jgi:hypothetical protein
MPRASSQEDSRISLRLRDIHGREWWATAEKETMTPTGVIQPLFDAPMYPPQQYLKPGGINNPTHLGIDYDQWVESIDQKDREWNRRLRMAAQKMYGEKAGEAIQNPSPELMHVVGPPPESADPVRACREGNRWVLGFAPTMPAWAEPHFGKPKQEAHVPAERRDFPDADEEETVTVAAGPAEFPDTDEAPRTMRRRRE